jgi:hypothetical protein
VWNRTAQSWGVGGGGAQTINIHVSKCENDKIKMGKIIDEDIKNGQSQGMVKFL